MERVKLIYWRRPAEDHSRHVSRKRGGVSGVAGPINGPHHNLQAARPRRTPQDSNHQVSARPNGSNDSGKKIPETIFMDRLGSLTYWFKDALNRKRWAWMIKSKLRSPHLDLRLNLGRRRKLLRSNPPRSHGPCLSSTRSTHWGNYLHALKHSTYAILPSEGMGRVGQIFWRRPAEDLPWYVSRKRGGANGVAGPINGPRQNLQAARPRRTPQDSNHQVSAGPNGSLLRG